MPDNVNPNPQGSANNPPPGTGTDPQGTGTDPAWLSTVPEEHRPAAKEAWMLKSDYTKKTTELSEREKAWNTEKEQLASRKEQLESFYRDQYEPFRQKLEQNWDRIAPILSGQQQLQMHPAQQQDGTNQWQYDPTMLSLMDQSGWDRLGQMYQARYVHPVVQQVQQALAQQFNQELVKREQLYQNYLRIMNDAYARKFQDPTLDIPKFMQQALAVQSGQINPLDVAYNQMTYDDRLKATEEAAFKRGQEDRDVHYKNQQVTNGAMGSTAIPVFRQKPLTRDQVTEAARQVAIKNNHPW